MQRQKTFMTDEDWIEWCSEHGINPSEAEFSDRFSYYGLGVLTTYPGALFVKDRRIVHHGYSVLDSKYSVSGKEKRVEIPFDAIAQVKVKKPSFLAKILWFKPGAVFEIKTLEGLTHTLVLYENSSELEDTLRRNGVLVLIK